MEDFRRGFFKIPIGWEKYWKGMPEFIQNKKTPYQSIIVHFLSLEDRNSFSKLVNQLSITRRTKYIWFPIQKKQNLKEKYWEAEERMNPKYPIYIISKGRWKTRLTSKALERMKVPYFIVVEPQEYDNYAKVIKEKKILTLPFSNLGQGSIPARNWVWEHSIKEFKSKRHWILDDNINGFHRLYNNTYYEVKCGNIFRAAEDFIDRYENIGLAGFQYRYFTLKREEKPPFVLNTRIYSCILINNNLSYRWRGKYNEDTDLSLRVLKDGWCTVLFYVFLADKITTMVMKGGNTDELYKGDGRLEMARSLQKQHPDVCKIVYKWNKWQHSVDYRRFKKNKLKIKGSIDHFSEVNNYGMYLKDY